jgi:hypothetical protein
LSIVSYAPDIWLPRATINGNWLVDEVRRLCLGLNARFCATAHPARHPRIPGVMGTNSGICSEQRL